MSLELKKNLPAVSIPEDYEFRMMLLSDEEFHLIRSLVYDRFGINLTDSKRSLVVGRLQKTLRQLGFASFMQFYEYLVQDTSGSALDSLINQISTNHTFFYREGAHFVYFRNTVLPEMKARLQLEQRMDFRVWCAGCSSGEEAYTIVIEMMEYFRAEYNLWDAGVLATDISTKVLRKAAAGIYSHENIRNTPAYARQYFKKKQDDTWEVSAVVKKEVTFRRFNFMNRIFPFKKLFHVIFCRNVMIYFDQATRAGLIERLHASLAPGGFLFIGHSESLGRQQSLFEYIMPAVYRKRGQ